MVGYVPAAAHDAAIQASWERCARSYRLLPRLARPIMRMRSTEVDRRREAFRSEIADLMQLIDAVAELAASAGDCLVITDRDQILVDYRERDGADGTFASHGIALGSSWNERVAGTNGVAMAVSTGRAFTVRGSDHFYEVLKPFACTAVPVFDALDDFIGAINISTIDRQQTAEYTFAQHVLNSTADEIQARLFRNRYGERTVVRLCDTIASRPPRANALAALDEAGRIVAITRAGRQSSPVLSAVPDLKGRSLEDLCGASLADLASPPDRVVSVGTGTTVRRAPRLEFVHGPGGQEKSSRPVAVSSLSVGARVSPVQVRRPSPTLQAILDSGTVEPGALERARRTLGAGLPLLISGPIGVGKTYLANALVEDLGIGTDAVLTIDGMFSGERPEPFRVRIEAFLAAQSRRSAVMLIDHPFNLPVYAQRLIAGLLDPGSVADVPSSGTPASVRILATVMPNTSTEGGALPLQPLMTGPTLTVAALEHCLPRARQNLARRLVRLLSGGQVCLTEAAADLIGAYPWPGNIRQMRLALSEAIACSEGIEIDRRHLPSWLRGFSTPAETEPRTRLALREALALAGWNVTHAARLMGISRATINRWISQEGLSRPLRSG